MEYKYQLLQSTGIVMFFTIISKVLGFGREMTIAAYFGATGDTDAYLVALSVPGILIAALGAAISTVLIPIFTQAYAKDAEQFQDVFNNFLTVLVIGFSMLFCIAQPLAPYLVRIMAPGFNQEMLGKATYLTRLMLPSIIFMGLSSLYSAALNSMQNFAVPSMVGLPYNVIIILSSVLLGKTYGITALAIGTVAAIVSQAVLQDIALHRRKVRYKPKLDWGSLELKMAAHLVLPVFLSSAVYQINTIVDKQMASMLTEGSISALSFANKLTMLPFGLFVGSLLTVLYPGLAETAMKEDWAGFRERLILGVKNIVIWVTPMMVGLIVLREPIVRVLFERKAFDAAATQMTAYAVIFYAVGLPFLSLNNLLKRGFWSLQDTKTPMIVGIVTVCSNIALNFVFVRFMAHGGLALATSLSVLIGTIVLLVCMFKRVNTIDMASTIPFVFKCTLASLLMGLLCNNLMTLLAGKVALPEVIRLGIVVVLAGVTYVFMLMILRVREVRQLFNLKVVEKLWFTSVSNDQNE
ncbi:MAG: murein biosynthesis integral membrane protein MurJ [Limnochordia bacterium]|nr:murein biosynthesis integral membrane protein MurJ [Limnochordia bacterium]